MYPPKLEQEQQARELFLTSEKTRTEIADEVGVSEKTISNWSVKGGWQDLKRASVQAPAVIVQQMYDEIEQINSIIRSRPEGQRHATPAEAELRRKIVISIRAVKRQLSTPELYQALRGFALYVSRRNERHRGLDYYIEEYIAGERSGGKHAIKPSEMEFGANEIEKKIPQQEDDFEEDFNEEDIEENPEFDLNAFVAEELRKDNERYIAEYQNENDGMIPWTEGCDSSKVFLHNMDILFKKREKEAREREKGNDK